MVWGLDDQKLTDVNEPRTEVLRITGTCRRCLPGECVTYHHMLCHVHEGDPQGLIVEIMQIIVSKVRISSR